MHPIIKISFVALIFLNNIPRDAGFPSLHKLRDGKTYNDIVTSKRQINDEDHEKAYNEFLELLSHLKKDDRQTVYTIIQITALVEARSCIKDEETRNNFGGNIYNTYAELYPKFKDEYLQLLDRIDKADQVILKRMVDRTKAAALETCKILFDDE
ncbi:unnamed protein product [Rotaria socialis]|uniref:Uncharacterized protein n=1 Tax=Rotaria socialis TaxID=392032 RepID=A0A820ZFA7_9BILA|nr:unnamed protein product [Rotaria socialis]CAF3360480.1 unnamed protein product [Rotaria socialis]CAF3363874.1 unnamed protein product [Rotaria socialis]CAF3562465.1 unnamed protein product [Rotaria socialis]CAF4323442.1 unnamed protein product [Rotaria socialis]